MTSELHSRSQIVFGTLNGRGGRFRLRGPTGYFPILAPPFRDSAKRIQQVNRKPLNVKVETTRDPWRVIYRADGTYVGEAALAGSQDVLLMSHRIDTNTLSRETEWEILEAVFELLNLTRTSGVSLKELLDRAHWAYGECFGGPTVVDHYAHAINNVISHSMSGVRWLYKRHKKLGFFEGKKGGIPYRRFAKSRKNLHRLDSLTNARATIAATIGAILGTTNNAVGAATNWLGGQEAARAYQNHVRRGEKSKYKDVTYVETNGGKFKHFFYNRARRQNSD